MAAPAPPVTLPDREWESSPMYIALSSRLVQTDKALAELSSQVAELAAQVKAALPSSSSSASTSTTTTSQQNTQPQATLTAPIPDLHVQASTPTPTFGTTATTATLGNSSSSSSEKEREKDKTSATDIAALTTQIAALSSSVAQLQRLQSQSQLTRQPSHPSANTTPAAHAQTAGSSAGNGFFDRGNANTPGPAPLGMGTIGLGTGSGTPGGHIGNTGPLTAPHGKSSFGLGLPGSGGLGMGSGMGGVAGGEGRTGTPGGGFMNGNIGRPNIPRSVSSSVVPPIGHPNGNGNGNGHSHGNGNGNGNGPSTPGLDDKWGAPKFHLGNNGHGAHSATAGLGHMGMGMQALNLNPLSPGIGSGARDWPSPGPSGMVTPSVSGGSLGLGSGAVSGAGTGTGAGPGVGSAAPGAGIVVTKWEHLSLKPELVRSISKYGIGPPNKIQARVLPFMLKGSDIIAQAPPTQERIISYVIPAIQLCLTVPPQNGPYRGPFAIIITTTVDQAAQAHKLIRNVGGPLGVRAALATGVAGSSNLMNEIQAMQREAVQILIGTPAKVLEVMTVRGGLDGSGVRSLILDEVDQLIARNLYENVLNLAKVLPSPRRGNGPLTPGGPFSPGPAGSTFGVASPYDAGQNSPFNPASKTPFPGQPSRFGPPGQPVPVSASIGSSPAIERQTCIFSNTIPTDVINFSQNLQVRDPVRVLVRREGSTNSQESVSSVTPGINLKHTYVYLTITGSARTEAPAESGPGTIGSGRAVNGQVNEEATRAKEYKLDMLVKMLDDYPLWQAVIYVGTYSMLEAVVYKLGGRQWDTLYLTPDMAPPQRKAVLQQWRLALAPSSSTPGPRFLVIFDVTVKPPEIPWSPLVVNFDLPRSVEGYAHRAAGAVPPNNARQALIAQAAAQANTNGGAGAGTGGAAGAGSGGGGSGPVNGVIVNFVQAAGGDVEMLRSTECAYRFKSAEIPSVFHDLFSH